MVEAGLIKSKQKLTVAEIQKTLQTVLGTEADISEAMTSLGLSKAIKKQSQKTVNLTSKKLQEAVVTGVLTEAQAQEFAMRTSLIFAMERQNNTTLPSWIANMKAMTVATLKQVKATLAWMVTNPAGWATAAVAGIIALTAVIWKLYDVVTVTLKEQKERLEEAKSAWTNIKNELQEVETELQNNINKIQELEALSNPSWVDQEELNRLKEVNKELERQKRLKQDESLKSAEKLYQENKETFNKEFASSFTVYDDPASVDALKQRLYSGEVSFVEFDLENNIVDIEAMLQFLRKVSDSEQQQKEQFTQKINCSECDSFQLYQDAGL